MESWIETKRKLTDGILYVDEHHKSCSKIKGMKIKLLPHQEKAIEAMCELETKRVIEVNIGKYKGYVETDSGILSNKYGTGKTLVIYGLISKNPVPSNIAEIGNPHLYGVNELGHLDQKYMGSRIVPELRRIYKKQMKQTIIFVSAAVLSHWEKMARQNTNLKIFMIRDVFGLRKFYELFVAKYDKKKTDKYDVIIVKNKVITGLFDPPELKGMPVSNMATKPLLNIFAELFRDTCFARVVLDDFDTLDIPQDAIKIPARFTWLVSASRKMSYTTYKPIGNNYNISEILMNERCRYLHILNNELLFTVCNICTELEFTDKCTNVGITEYYLYTFVNPNEQYIGLLGTMNVQEANNIMQMLNADAPETAAQAAGIASTDPADIFSKILGNQWNTYKECTMREQYSDQVLKFVKKLPEIEDLEDSITNEKLKMLKKNLKSVGPIKMAKKIIKYNENKVTSLVETFKSSNIAKKADSGKAIQRVKDRLTGENDACPICCENWNDKEKVQAIVIMGGCCGNVMCSGCALSSSGVTNFKNVGTNVVLKCENCRKDVSVKSLIYMATDSMDVIINDKFDTSEPEPETKEEESEQEESEDPVDAEDEKTKIGCLIKIIKGRKLKSIERKPIEVNFPTVLKGSSKLPDADKDDTKMLVLAYYKETVDKISKKLKEYKIPHVLLEGRSENLDEIVRRYWLKNSDKKSIRVLVINTQKHCAGLDLQNTTDIIFTHKIGDKNIESQLIARGLRIGRVNNLRVHYLAYANESNYVHL